MKTYSKETKEVNNHGLKNNNGITICLMISHAGFMC